MVPGSPDPARKEDATPSDNAESHHLQSQYKSLKSSLVSSADHNSKSLQNLPHIKQQAINYQNQISKARENRSHMPTTTDETMGDLQRIKSMPLLAKNKVSTLPLLYHEMV